MAEKVNINSTQIVQKVDIVSAPNITRVYITNQNASILSGQNNTWREVFLGFYQNPTSFANLFNQELVVSETENVMLVLGQIGLVEEAPIIERYKFARGKGTWNPIPRVVGTDIIYESSSNANSGDIITITQGANTQTYNLGDITGTSLVDYINNNGPYDMSSPQLTYLFLYIDDNITYLYQFIGSNGVYGNGFSEVENSDFVFITSSQTTPSIPVFNLTVQEESGTPNTNINIIEFADGTTVENLGGGKVKVTPPSGGTSTDTLADVMGRGNETLLPIIFTEETTEEEVTTVTQLIEVGAVGGGDAYFYLRNFLGTNPDAKLLVYFNPLSDVELFLPDLGGSVFSTIFVNSNLTATENYFYYIKSGTRTITDPSTSEGYYLVFCGAGSAIVGGVTYPVGSYIFRYYNGTSWQTKLLSSSQTLSEVLESGNLMDRDIEIDTNETIKFFADKNQIIFDSNTLSMFLGNINSDTEMLETGFEIREGTLIMQSGIENITNNEVLMSPSVFELQKKTFFEESTYNQILRFRSPLSEIGTGIVNARFLLPFKGDGDYTLATTEDIVGSEWIVVSSNQTAENDKNYSNVANATYTDPSPVEGKGFTVKVVNGTATIGGVGYGEGRIVTRTFHNGSWRTKVYVDETIIGSATQTALNTRVRFLANKTAGSHTGNNNEEIIGSIEVLPSNLTGNDILTLLGYCAKDTGAVNTYKMYMNTSLSLWGATQLAIYTSAAANREMPFGREFFVRGGNIEGTTSTTNSMLTTIGVLANQVGFSIAFDHTITNYLIITTMNGDNTVISRCKATTLEIK